jgi:curved DNA-binding protein CbpA
MSSDGRYRGANDKEGKPNPFVEIVTTGRHSQPGPGTGRHSQPGGPSTGRHSQPGTGRHGVAGQTTGQRGVSSKSVREEPREGARRFDPRSDDFDERSAPVTEPAPPPGEIDDIERLARLSLEPPALGPATEPSPEPMASAAPAARTAAAESPAAAPAASVAQPTSAVVVNAAALRATAEPAADLPPELLARLRDAAELHGALRTMNHYQLLGVTSQATTREVRAAYFALSKRFHPDAFFRKEIGGYRAKLESVFDALTGAYETLRRGGTRSDYDDSIGLPQALRHLPESSRSSRPPGARLESEFDRVQREVERRTPSLAPPATHAVPPAPPAGAHGKLPGAGRPATPPESGPTTASRDVHPGVRPSQQRGKTSRPPATRSSDRARSAGSDRASPAANGDRGRATTASLPQRQRQEMGPSTRTMNLPPSARDASTRPAEAGEARGTGTVARSGGPLPQGSSAKPPAVSKAPSGPAAQAAAASAPANPFDDDARRSTLLRELDQLMQARLQSTPPSPASNSNSVRHSAPPPGFGSPSTGSVSAPPTGTFGRPVTGTTGTTSLVPEGGSRPPHAGPSLVELADQLQGGGGLHNWASQRLREAYHEEQAGHVVDAANIVRIVLNQLKDPHIEAHVQRLGRLVAQKTAPAQKMRARAAEKDGNWKEAAECWSKVREGNPADAQAAFHHARALMQAGDLKSAGRAAMRAAELAPEHVETRELLIEFFEKMGMKLNARRERDTVQKLLEAKAKGASKTK